MVKPPPIESMADPTASTHSCELVRREQGQRAGGEQMVKPFIARVLPLPFVPLLLGFGEAAGSSDAVHSPLEIRLLEAGGQGSAAARRAPRAARPRRKRCRLQLGGSKTCQYSASNPLGRSTCAALRAPSTGSTQCQACPATTASKVRPLRVPIFELADLDVDPGLPGEVGHPLVHVDAEYLDTRRPGIAERRCRCRSRRPGTPRRGSRR